MTDGITVRFDVIGWTPADRDHHEADVAKIRSFVSGAVLAGLDSMDISTEIFDYNGGGLFSNVDVSRTDRTDGTIVMSVLAFAGSIKVQPVAEVIDIRNYIKR